MKTPQIAMVTAATLLQASFAFGGCGNSNNPSSTATGAQGSSGGTNTSTSSSSSSGAGSSSGAVGPSSSSSSSGSNQSSATSDASSTLPSCSAVVDGGVTDKVTTCTTGTSPTCSKGCGPDLPAGSDQTNLGTKSCACTAGAYACADCVYESPLPSCYEPSATPPACPDGTADKASCTTPCSGTTTGVVCTIATDAGKTEGCVCISAGAGDVWTCATQWW